MNLIEDHEDESLVSIDTIKRWGFANPKLAVNAAHQMKLVDGVPADQLRQALIEAGMSVRDDVRIPDLTAEIAAIFAEETRPRPFAISSRRPSLDEYDNCDRNGE